MSFTAGLHMTQSQPAKTCLFMQKKNPKHKVDCRVCIVCARSFISYIVELRGVRSDQGFALGGFQVGRMHCSQGGCGSCEGLLCGVYGKMGDD